MTGFQQTNEWIRKTCENKTEEQLYAKKIANNETFNKNGLSNNTKSFSIYEKAKFSTSVELAYNNSYRKIDVDYDTTFNNRFKKANLLIDVPQYLDKAKKSLYLDLLNSNVEFIKNNKVSQEIIENQNYFTKLVNSL